MSLFWVTWKYHIQILLKTFILITCESQFETCLSKVVKFKKNSTKTDHIIFCLRQYQVFFTLPCQIVSHYSRQYNVLNKSQTHTNALHSFLQWFFKKPDFEFFVFIFLHTPFSILHRGSHLFSHWKKTRMFSTNSHI